MKVAKVYLKQKNRRIDQEYSYLVPDDIEVGQRIVAPFGKGNRKLEGIVTEIIKNSNHENLKEILYKIDPISYITPKQLELAKYLKRNSYQIFYTCLNNFTAFNPTRKRKDGTIKSFNLDSDYEIELIKEKKVRGKVQEKIIEFLHEHPITTYKELKSFIPSSKESTLTRLEELGIIKVRPIRVVKNNKFESTNKERQLSKNFIKIIDNDYYKKLIESLTEHKQGQVLILFPTNFKAYEFYNYLKKNSNLNPFLYSENLKGKELFDFYLKVLNNETKLIISSSKGLFLPFNDLETIFVTEVNHDNYRPTEINNYDSLDLVQELAKIHKSNLILTDFIDSVYTNYQIVNKKWNNQDELSQDYSFEIKKISIDSENEVLSPELIEGIKKNLEENKKTILLMNRKGYFNYTFCEKCHEPLKCPKCGSVLQSNDNGKVNCKVCGFKNDIPSECSYCQNKTFKKVNIGLDKILSDLQTLFPDAVISPYFREHTPEIDNSDIIVGTTKLLYHPKVDNVGTVGAVLIDLDFNYPSYSSSESALRNYSELFLKYDDSDKVFQTFLNESNVFDALDGNTSKFLEEQKNYRDLANLPPYYDLYVFTLTGKNAKEVNSDVESLQHRLKKIEELDVLPPNIVRKKKGTSQRQFIVKDKKNGKLRDYLYSLYENGEIEALNSKVSLIINPTKI